MKIKLKNITYIKDLGNIKIDDSHRIKRHLLYRSSNLAGLNSEEIDKLVRHNIKYVCDFRTDEEKQKKPELNDVDSILYHHLPLVENADNPMITKENRLEILKKIAKSEGGAKKYMSHFYSTLVDNPKAINSYKAFFKILIESKDNEAVLFHCTQGKDRTGIGLMLLLSALGAHKNVIVKQYLAYNRISRLFRSSVYVGMFFTKGVKLANALNDILRAVKSYIFAAYDTIEKKYQSMQNYLGNIIGLTNENIKLLKQKYLM